MAEVAAVGELGVNALAGEFPTPSSAVLTLGVGDDGAEVVALWHVSPEGVATGAWVVPQAEAFQDEQAARRLLTSVDGRAVTGADPDTVTEAVRKLGKAARLEVPDGWWSASSFSPVEVFGG